MPTDADERASNAMPLTVESDQNSDSLIHFGNDYVSLRLLSSRCHEARAQGLPNQDYACLLVDQESLCFCVCDGVGSSFMGGFAAKFLGTRLVEWFRSLDSELWQPGEVESLHASLATALTGWADDGQTELSRVRTTPLQSSLVQEVLEELRTSHGSETVFCSGRIDLPRSRGVKASRETAQVLLCWMGNVTVTLLKNERDEVDVGYVTDDNTAWSTARGLRGTPHLFLAPMETLHRLIVHTDGADSMGQSISDLDDTKLSDSVLDLHRLATSDDVTVLDVQWKP